MGRLFSLDMARDTYRAPRKAARRVIENVRNPFVIAFVFGLSVTLDLIVTAIYLIYSGAYDRILMEIVVELAINFLFFVFFVGLVFGVGKLFGGKGTILSIAAVLSWYLLATMPVPYFFADAFVSAVPVLSIVFLINIIFVDLWLFGSLIAEAHGFENARYVACAYAGVAVSAILSLYPLLSKM